MSKDFGATQKRYKLRHRWVGVGGHSAYLVYFHNTDEYLLSISETDISREQSIFSENDLKIIARRGFKPSDFLMEVVEVEVE